MNTDTDDRVEIEKQNEAVLGDQASRYRSAITALMCDGVFCADPNPEFGMAHDLKMAIGARVRAARKRTGMTQEALAAAISKTAESVFNIERGRQLPMLDTLADLAAALGLPLSDLVVDPRPSPMPGRKRLALEATLTEHICTMDDRLLAIAVEQVGILSRTSAKS